MRLCKVCGQDLPAGSKTSTCYYCRRLNLQAEAIKQGNPYMAKTAKNRYRIPEGQVHKRCPNCSSKLLIIPEMPFGGCAICRKAFLIDQTPTKKHDKHYVHLTLL